MELFSALPPLPPEIRELLMYAVPFICIAFVAAAVMFLTRDLLGKPDPYRRNGNGNGKGRRHGRQNGGAPREGNGYYRNGNGNGNGHGAGDKKTGNGNVPYGAGDLAIPTLAQPAALEGDDIGVRMENWFSRLLYESGAPFARDVAFLTELGGGLLVGGIVLIWTENIVLAVLGFAAGMSAVVSLYVFARARRRRIMREQLPDLIDHLARAVRAGQTVDQALHLVGEASPEPLGVEFRRCSGQLNMGLSVDAAMQALSRRVPIPEMRILASTFIVQRRAGGSLPITLERLAKVTRDRISYYRQFRAATAGSRMSMFVIALTAPLVAIYMMIYRPEMFDLFFQSPVGWFFFFTSIALYVAGLTWIYYILRIDY